MRAELEREQAQQEHAQQEVPADDNDATRRRPRPDPRAFDTAVPREEREQLLREHADRLRDFVEEEKQPTAADIRDEAADEFTALIDIRDDDLREIRE